MVRLLALVLALSCVIATSFAQEEDSDVEYSVHAPSRSAQINSNNNNNNNNNNNRAPTKSQPRVAPENDPDYSDDEKPIKLNVEVAKEPELPKFLYPKRYEIQTDWTLEIALTVVFVIQIIFYFVGKSQNAALAQKWIVKHASLLADNFILVGLDATGTNQLRLIRESSARMFLFCTGRRNCHSAVFRFSFCSRQDLFSTIYNAFSRARDELIITVTLDARDMPTPYSIALVPLRGHKSYKDTHPDLSSCVVRGVGFKGLPASLALISESESVANDLLSQPICDAIAANAKYFHSLHVTDANPFPDARGKHVLRVRLFLPNKQNMEELDSLLRVIFVLIDKIGHVRITEKELKAAKQKREEAEKETMKATAQQIQEDVLRKKAEARRREKEALEKRIEGLPADQRKKMEMKILEKERKKQQSGMRNKIRIK